MKNTNESTALMAQRIVKDWADSPAGLRNPVSSKDIPSYQIRSAGFCFMLRIFQEQVSAKAYDDSKDVLTKKNAQVRGR